MCRRVIKDHPMRWIMQEGRPTGHRAQDAFLAFHTKAAPGRCLPAQPRWQHQRFRLMNIQVIKHQMPRAWHEDRWQSDVADERAHPLPCASAPRGENDLTAHHIEVDEPGQRSMPDILEFPPERMTWLHGQIRMFARHRLAPRSTHLC